MKTIKLLSVFVLLLLCVSGISAITTDALYKKITATYGSFSTFQASVKQDNYFAQIKKSISYQGNIYFTRGRMVIKYDKPNVQRLMISDGMVDLYDAQSKTVLRSRMRPEFGKMNPVEILQVYWKKSTVRVLSSKGTISEVSLKPYDDPLIVSMTATINHKTGLVQTLSYTDASDNKVTYSFSAVKTNVSIPNSVWKFTYPKDVQVVER
ncbi:MAG: outer membrane lipoprotein carrier protein LolA [Candidatus Cloacimonetes bacterium HGW-Cloacimonetes-3]|jgi:outer membrane lipoprotein-sorting protein|nr:MAG: outer membrane lipoprotein carrier protein LolA [Candidatus Cloacimonetes bacterium HGW-Cloacimonetes-3]